jgi:phage-related protein
MGRLEAHPTIKITLCGTGILPVLDNNLRIPLNKEPAAADEDLM